MLTNGKYEGVVDCKPSTLGLHDVEIVTLGMRRWMAHKELVRRILASVDNGERESKRMRDIPA
jgi:hypothetical protein